MKERTGLIFKIIIAITGAVIGVLIWAKKIPLPEGWNGIPLGLVSLLAAPIYYLIDFLIKKPKKKKDDSTVIQEGEKSILFKGDVTGGHVGHTTIINHNPKPYIDKMVELAEAKALAEKDREFWKENYNKLKSYCENMEKLPDYKKRSLELWAEGRKKEAIESVDTTIMDKEAADRHIFRAQLFIDNFQFDEAEQDYIQAVTIFPSYDNNFAAAYFYSSLNNFSEAISFYNYCIGLTNIPEEKARVLNNLAILHRNVNEYPKALKEYEKALEIYRKLAEDNPNAYLPDVAMTLNNLANLHQNINEYPKALKEYEEALEIRRKLAEDNPNAYLPNVATTLNNLAVLHWNVNEYPKALKEYEEALEIYRKLAEDNPNAYLPYVATTLNNLAVLHDDISNKELSLKYANEVVKVLIKCNDTPFVRTEFKKARWIIEKWNNK